MHAYPGPGTVLCNFARQQSKQESHVARQPGFLGFASITAMDGTGTSDSDRVCMAPFSHGNALWSIGLGESDSSHATVAGQ